MNAEEKKKYKEMVLLFNQALADQPIRPIPEEHAEEDAEDAEDAED